MNTSVSAPMRRYSGWRSAAAAAAAAAAAGVDVVN